jgi:hypothetical protein
VTVSGKARIRLDVCSRKASIFSELFARQALGNPIKRQQMGPRRDKGVAARVQNILKKVKKNLVRGQNLH